LKENSLLDDILVENSKIDPKMKRKKSAFCWIMPYIFYWTPCLLLQSTK
jgi:hypothetical protein